MFQIQVVEKIETHLKFSNIFENRPFYERMWKNMIRVRRATDAHPACALHPGCLRLQTHSEFVILVTFPRQHCTNATHYYDVSTPPAFLLFGRPRT
jgi:hypothetical protein